MAPVISIYIARMMEAEYPQKYRQNTLTRAIRIYDKMIAEDKDGIRPLFRPKEWNVVARRLEKQNKKHVPVLNTKREWHQPSLYSVQNEIYRG